MSERQPPLPNRQTPFSEAFREFIARDWDTTGDPAPAPLPAAAAAVERRRRISAQFPGERLVIPAGGLKVRSNDTDFRYRPHSAFAHLTGLGTDREPDAVLVLEPVDAGNGSVAHEATVFFTPRAPRDSEEFFADTRYGELWVGRRPSLDEMSALCGIRCAARDRLDAELAKDVDTVTVRVVREADPAVTELIDRIRAEHSGDDRGSGDEAAPPAEARTTTDELGRDLELAVALSELRLVKDEFELQQMREACAATVDAFRAVAADLPVALRQGRGERWVEGIFGLHARHRGNAVGYDTIAASGHHACTLHWIRNDGELSSDDLILIDAGIELDTLYTADITRTLPVGGRFSEAQRQVYEAVLEAQQAGIDAARPGALFLDVHRAAVAVLARHLAAWGLLPVSPEESLSETGGQHRRWMVHGTSHHLGIDVHDCAQARSQYYREGTLQPGMVITVEPGLYLRRDDLLVPERLRGIGVRIEDDILITADAPQILSDGLPRGVEEIEAWMADLQA